MAQLTFKRYLSGIYKLNLFKSNSVHHAIIQSIYDCFIKAGQDIDVMRLEMCLNTASGIWLDYWGEYFAVYRRKNESDDVYSKRIIHTVIRPKSTIPAIKDHIADYLNWVYETNYTSADIFISEPWKELAKYSHKGTLSNTARMFSGDYYSHAVIDISIPEDVTDDVVNFVNTVKAAGVKVYWSVLNQYEIMTDYYNTDNTFAFYVRRHNLSSKYHINRGLTLSNSSAFEYLSGKQEIYERFGHIYEWFAYIKDKLTDKSQVITKTDLVGVLNTYDNGKPVTDDLHKYMYTLYWFNTYSDEEKEEFIQKTGFNPAEATAIFNKLQTDIQLFKSNNTEYYNSLQPMLLSGEHAMWLVKPHNNWLFTTPLMSLQDFYIYWSDSELGEFTLDNIFDFEKAQKLGYLDSFGSIYQSPIVISEKQYSVIKLKESWLFDSPVLTLDDLEALYTKRLSNNSQVDNDIILKNMIMLDGFIREHYPIAEDVQSEIIIKGY